MTNKERFESVKAHLAPFISLYPLSMPYDENGVFVNPTKAHPDRYGWAVFSNWDECEAYLQLRSEADELVLKALVNEKKGGTIDETSLAEMESLAQKIENALEDVKWIKEDNQ